MILQFNGYRLKQLLVGVSVSLGALICSAQSKANTQAFAFELGRQSGAYYCKGISLESAMEKGTMGAALAMDIPMSQLDAMDLSSDQAAMALIEGLLDTAIDTCPQRAKTIFREFTTLGN